MSARRAAAWGAWGLATVVAALACPRPAPPSVWAAPLVGGVVALGLARARPVAAAGALAVGVAPLWVGAVLQADAAGGAVLLAAIAALGLRAGALPVGVSASLVALGLVESMRALAVGGTLPASVAAAAPLLLAGLTLGGAAAAPPPPRILAGSVAGVGLALGGVWFGVSAPTTTRAAVAQARAGRLDADLLVAASPGRALAVLAAAPRSHDLALALGRRRGFPLPLSVGWAPGGDLTPDERVAVARWLDVRGRGGEGRRLLGPARDDPEARWLEVLLLRQEALPDGEGGLGRAPAGTPGLPGAVDLQWAFLSNGARAVEVDVSAPCQLVLHLRIEPEAGGPRLEVEVDGQDRRSLAPGGSGRHAAHTLSSGPHRIRARFTNDGVGRGGDRNLWVDGLSCVTEVSPRPAPDPRSSGAPASPTPR